MKEERLLYGYYQSNIKTSRNEDSVYAMKYASQQILIDKLEEENKSLQSQLKEKEEVIDKLKKHCEIEINASNHYLENHKSQKELCHKVAHQRILEILSKGGQYEKY